MSDKLNTRRLFRQPATPSACIRRAHRATLPGSLQHSPAIVRTRVRPGTATQAEHSSTVSYLKPYTTHCSSQQRHQLSNSVSTCPWRWSPCSADYPAPATLRESRGHPAQLIQTQLRWGQNTRKRAAPHASQPPAQPSHPILKNTASNPLDVLDSALSRHVRSSPASLSQRPLQLRPTCGGGIAAVPLPCAAPLRRGDARHRDRRSARATKARGCRP